MIKPFSPSTGPCKLKKTCANPDKNTGTEPVSNINANFFLWKFVTKKGWKPKEIIKNGIQLANPIQDKAGDQLKNC